MENGRKRVGIVLTCVVCIAIIMGIIYYATSKQEQATINEGTLVQEYMPGVKNLCQLEM